MIASLPCSTGPGLLAEGLSVKSAEELAGLGIAELAPALEQRPEQARGPGGREFRFSYKMDPAGFKGTLIQVRDVTGQVIDATAIDSAREQADMIEQARTAFISQVAHHFRTPLHVILGYVDILAEAEDGTMDRLTRDSYSAVHPRVGVSAAPQHERDDGDHPASARRAGR
jgi:signal transduction histidine kinase